ncbi:MAG TPA: alpha-isopropylmalate synthase regulatory domain-containing protein, partial [Gammaproteobacteria bacterium]|nr:alpha-isopropylmalate synthase regulatory domain-containing protein [Gammaproteobacteria bacterium]
AGDVWDVPYLPIDPYDVGRSYEAVIRVNSQSGKGGVAYLLERDQGVVMPRRLQIEFSGVVQEIADRTGKELSSAMIWDTFRAEYLDKAAPFKLQDYRSQRDSAQSRETLSVTIEAHGKQHIVGGRGNGPIAAFVDALNRQFGFDLQVVDFREHAVGHGADAPALAYVEIGFGGPGRTLFGVGRNGNIVTASLEAVVSAVNRAAKHQPEWLQVNESASSAS